METFGGRVPQRVTAVSKNACGIRHLAAALHHFDEYVCTIAKNIQ